MLCRWIHFIQSAVLHSLTFRIAKLGEPSIFQSDNGTLFSFNWTREFISLSYVTQVRSTNDPAQVQERGERYTVTFQNIPSVYSSRQNNEWKLYLGENWRIHQYTIQVDRAFNVHVIDRTWKVNFLSVCTLSSLLKYDDSHQGRVVTPSKITKNAWIRSFISQTKRLFAQLKLALLRSVEIWPLKCTVRKACTSTGTIHVCTR